MSAIDTKRFCLREVAGKYFLLDISQNGHPYQKPIILNETAAYIFKGLEDGKNPKEIAFCIASLYEIDVKDIMNDIDEFIRELEGVISL